MSKASLFVGQRPAKHNDDLVFGERSQFEDLRPGDEGGIDEEKWIMGGGADEPNRAAFHIRKQHILLRFVKSVDFVNEQQRRLSGIREAVGGGGQDTAHLRNV